MMLILSHIFGRRVFYETDSEAKKEAIHRSPSIVYLPPLPTEAAEILRKHSTETIVIFTTYVKTFAAQHLLDEESCLPLSHIPMGIAATSFDTPPRNAKLESRSHKDSSENNNDIKPLTLP